MSFTYGDMALRRNLEERFQEKMEDQIKEVSTGMADDYADYRFRCGGIAMLSWALQTLDDVFREMNGDNRGKR